MSDKIVLFTSAEKLWDKVSHERLLEIINRDDVDVVECNIGENHYFIECQFVHIRTDDGQVFAFYGNGEHNQKEKWIADEWSFYGDSNADFMGRKRADALDKEKVLADIEQQRQYVLKNKAEEEGRKRSGRAIAYEWASNMLGDDDGLEGDLDDFFGDDFDMFEDDDYGDY